ncbi:MAG: zinc ribbon domain-containing protein [Phycisphaerales bacterium]|jgi:putative FmdB family regulatory protein|nr:zinc ribbon domain-containing protein [Phycisphaerales bacterium]
MPTYDYACRACGHEFELFQSMKDASKRKCPKCGKNALERLIGTGAAVIFKGGGFYETDYRSETYKKAAKAESESKPAASDGASSGSAQSSEAKPAGSKGAEKKPPAASSSAKPSEAKPATGVKRSNSKASQA